MCELSHLHATKFLVDVINMRACGLISMMHYASASACRCSYHSCSLLHASFAQDILHGRFTAKQSHSGSEQHIAGQRCQEGTSFYTKVAEPLLEALVQLVSSMQDVLAYS